jgi:hypothetical protein
VPCGQVAVATGVAREGTYSYSACHCKATWQLQLRDQNTSNKRGAGRTDLARLHDFVVLEWVEVVLDMNRSLLDNLGAKKWIGRRR